MGWAARPAQHAGAEEPQTPAPPTVAEARQRARLLHETIHGTLQVMHRDFFREDEKLKIPSRSLEDVFSELAKSHKVEVRWLAVNAEAMSVDHKPQTDFERSAVRAIAAGKAEYDEHDAARYQYAGAIRLGSQCLKCHLPNRKSTEDRQAALVLSFPLQAQAPGSPP
jgi:hypothetical protein